jgi:lipoate-protein ligase A
MPREIVSYTHDDDLIAATRQDGQPRMRIYRPPDPMVVLGRGSKPEVELHLKACHQDQVPVLRRHGGGCAVLLDPGNVIVTVTLPATGIGDNPRHFASLSRWLVDGLARIRGGFGEVQQRGISDLALGDRKVGGACIYRSKGLLCYSATLLVEPQVELMERYLKHPPREPDYRGGRSHARFVGTLPGYTADQLATDLRHSLRIEELPSLPATRTSRRTAAS